MGQVLLHVQIPLGSVVDPWGQQRYFPFESLQVPVPSGFIAGTLQHSLNPERLLALEIKFDVRQHWFLFFSGQELVVPPMQKHLLFLSQQVSMPFEFVHSVRSVELQKEHLVGSSEEHLLQQLVPQSCWGGRQVFCGGGDEDAERKKK
jgi:hypothetical protein